MKPEFPIKIVNPEAKLCEANGKYWIEIEDLLGARWAVFGDSQSDARVKCRILEGANHA